MSKINQGILGGFSGKTGTVIGSRWKGQSIMRSLPKYQKNRPYTQDQLDQQAKFKLIVDMLSGMSDLLSISFKTKNEKGSGYNAAVSENLKNAILGESPAFFIDYASVKLSRGSIPNANAPAARASSNHHVLFTWGNNSSVQKAKGSDLAILVVFCPDLNQSVYVLQGGTRNDEAYEIDAGVFAGYAVETWLAFMRDDGDAVSNSVYTGSVVLAP